MIRADDTGGDWLRHTVEVAAPATTVAAVLAEPWLLADSLDAVGIAVEWHRIGGHRHEQLRAGVEARLRYRLGGLIPIRARLRCVQCDEHGIALVALGLGGRVELVASVADRQPAAPAAETAAIAADAGPSVGPVAAASVTAAAESASVPGLKPGSGSGDAVRPGAVLACSTRWLPTTARRKAEAGSQRGHVPPHPGDALWRTQVGQPKPGDGWSSAADGGQPESGSWPRSVGGGQPESGCGRLGLEGDGHSGSGGRWPEATAGGRREPGGWPSAADGGRAESGSRSGTADGGQPEVGDGRLGLAGVGRSESGGSWPGLVRGGQPESGGGPLGLAGVGRSESGGARTGVAPLWLRGAAPGGSRLLRRVLDVVSARVRSRAEQLMGAPVVVGTAIIAGGSVLAAQRERPAALAGRWEFPGGRVEAGETEPEAVVRECHEELGAAVRVVGRVGPDLILPSGWLLRIHAADLVDGQHPEALEHRSLRWITTPELESLNWIDADRVVLPALRALLDDRARGNHAG